MRFICRYTIGATLSTFLVLPLAAAAASNATSVKMNGPTTVNLGAPVAYGATIAGTSNQLATWSLSPATGLGSISTSGVYTPPSAVVWPDKVTIRATSRQTPTVSGSITVNLLNAIPVITSATAVPASASGSYVLDVQGYAFAPGAKLMVAGTQINPTRVSASELRKGKKEN